MLLNVGDRLTMKKKHPCGSFQFTVTRTGADIGIKCVGCGRDVMLPRQKVEKMIKKIERDEV